MPVTIKHQMTPREIFIYIMMSIMKDENLAALGTDKKTVILDEMRKEFCPSVDDNDWASLAREIDSNQPEVEKALMRLVKLEDYQTIYEGILERFNKRK